MRSSASSGASIPPASTRRCSTLPAGESRGRRAAQGDPGGDPRDLHRAGEGAPRRALTGPEDDLFSGEYWTGAKRSSSALSTRIGDLRTVLRERFGDKVATPLVARRRSLFGRRALGHRCSRADGGRGRLVSAGECACGRVSGCEERALWAPISRQELCKENRNAAFSCRRWSNGCSPRRRRRSCIGWCPKCAGQRGLDRRSSARRSATDAADAAAIRCGESGDGRCRAI